MLSSTRTTRSKTKRGFTLVELVIVAGVMSLLASIILQSTSPARMRSRNLARSLQIDQIQKAFELSATVTGSNKLPATSSGGTTIACLGLTTDTTPSCGGSVNGDSTNAAVTALLQGSLSGSAGVPRDPFFQNNLGTAYLYRSNFSVDLSASAGIGTECATAGVCPSGAYLLWVIENATSCGRAKSYQFIGLNTQCALRIADPIIN